VLAKTSLWKPDFVGCYLLRLLFKELFFLIAWLFKPISIEFI